jgi:hypothetical protein
VDRRRTRTRTHLLDSFSSCSDSGNTVFGTDFAAFASNNTPFLPDFLSAYSITEFQRPDTSPTSLLPGPLTSPWI